MNGTNTLKTWGATAALAAVLPLAAASPGFAQGYGPCTPPAGMAVGAAGPAMSGGQLMAGVGQCQSIASWHRGHHYRRPVAVAGWNSAYNDGGGWYGGGWGGQGPGPYTPLFGRAVGPAGPAMSSGQWLAGVGQARPIGSGNNAYWGGGGWYGGGWGGQGPGPYTPLSGSAVGPAGPAMSSGQWLAGVGQARPIGNGNNWNGYNATGYATGQPYYYGGPGYW
ncbi:hypothetical protein [Bradyrhizobium sp.]|jgi:hypothetical protein|uniref:hypothetical protein n=1 Tax=Bradyrhizobium sp. TaxID=376 RepID=UPI002D7FB504|nr:hypothetical protein [Bradyrhizobium sp.]